MGQTLTEKILKAHLIEGRLTPGEEIGIKIDQTLTQDATGTMTYLQFEALELPRVKTELSVSYVDHSMLQTGFETMDDHLFLQSMASKYGALFSKPGNGICHQVHLERFGIPGKTLLGSDSHTPNAGALGMIAIGAGGLDVAIAMGGGPFYLTTPGVVGVELTGKLRPWVAAKDVILEVLRRMTVKGGVGRIIEYHGDGVKNLSVPERATITNMGAELGATTSIFPSDERTQEYLALQGREKAYTPIAADSIAEYDEEIKIDLASLEPLIAQPQSPDNVIEVRKIAGKKVHQVLVGSCNNSSIKDLMTAEALLRGKHVNEEVSFGVTPGSRQVLETISRNGALASIVKAGARVLECACDGCIGMGQAPASEAVSVRTYNRNFPGRSGTKKDRVYLSSVEVAVAAALMGEITDPREMGKYPRVELPLKLELNDNMIIPPSDDPDKVEIIRGPNIKPLPRNAFLADSLKGDVLLKVGDNITTDHIMPAGARILPLRSNIPAISEYVFYYLDPDFAARAKKKGGGFIIGGVNYGQGSSREHAALAPMYLGVKAVLAKSFARIHKANLINFGILPLVFEDAGDYDAVEQGDVLVISAVRRSLNKRIDTIEVENTSKNESIKVRLEIEERHYDVLLAGGRLNYMKQEEG